MNRRIQAQREFFDSGRTRSLKWRQEQLQTLKKAIKQYEKDLLNAVYADLGKSAFEGFATEIGLLYEEINYTSKHLDNWCKPEKVKSSPAQLPGKCSITYEPRGLALVIAPWNYPIQLTLLPMISAIAAGNCVILKPSEYAAHTSQAITEMIRECFPAEFLDVYQGGPEVTQGLIKENIDYIFFTGSTTIGKEIIRLASDKIIPMTLELGGKSPVIVDRSANLAISAKRIMWGKLINCGQTCVAPDYILVHTDVKDALIDELKKAAQDLYPGGALTHPDYGKIINQKHFDRLISMLEMGKVIYGGQYDPQTLKIAPTLMERAKLDSPLMKEEIFGPILPIFNFESLEDAFALIRRRHKPLALYVFSEDADMQQKIVTNVAFGGGCINDTVMHIANPRLPFGGIGGSGIGAYHGRAGFEAFSHRKSIFTQPTNHDLPLRYPPYGDKLDLAKKLYK